jgi:FkbM family methyltransferase
MHTDLRTANGLGLFRYGLHGAELDLIERILGAGDTFVDGGANVGTFTLVGARKVGPLGRVLAFEPGAKIAATLRANARLNELPWLEIHTCALGNFVGEQTFVEFGGDGAGLSSFAPAAIGKESFSGTVEVTTLDRVLGSDEVAFVKLDLEGSEARALAGAEGVLANARPDLLIEVEPDHLARQGSSPGEIDAILISRGYTIFELIQDSTLQLRRLERSEERAMGPNVFATARAERLPGLGISISE